MCITNYVGYARFDVGPLSFPPIPESKAEMPSLSHNIFEEIVRKTRNFCKNLVCWIANSLNPSWRYVNTGPQSYVGANLEHDFCVLVTSQTFFSKPDRSIFCLQNEKKNKNRWKEISWPQFRVSDTTIKTKFGLAEPKIAGC